MKLSNTTGVVPVSMLRNAAIPSTAVKVFAYLDYLDQNKMTQDAQITAKTLHMSTWTLSRAYSILVKNGYISRERHLGDVSSTKINRESL